MHILLISFAKEDKEENSTDSACLRARVSYAIVSNTNDGKGVIFLFVCVSPFFLFASSTQL